MIELSVSTFGRLYSLLVLACVFIDVSAAGLPVGIATDAISPETAIWSTKLPWSNPAFFPIAVWLQSPSNAETYRKAGFNTYVGLWQGPTEEQLAQLKAIGMFVICEQNDIALHQPTNSAIIGWLRGDEPDNAQEDGKGGYGPPITPEKVLVNYTQIRGADISRPVLLNLSEGVAWDDWAGRGARSNHPEDYSEYTKACDIASFDIYPVNHEDKQVQGKLWYVAKGVRRLKEWSHGKPTWNCIECTAIGGLHKPTPAQVRAEAWMSLISGSRGLIYFVHQFKPSFAASALLNDPEMLAAVTQLNHQIAGLAPVLNAPSVPIKFLVQTNNASISVTSMAKEFNGSLYLFAVAMADGNGVVTFKSAALDHIHSVEVIDEGRVVAVKNGYFKDHFGPWEVHLYQLPLAAR